MPTSLPDLRAQRDIIKSHLDWLDARIAESEGPAAVADREVPAPPPGATTETLPEPGPARAEVVADQILSTYAGGEEILTPATKNGCIFAAMAFILLFLLTLFGLPYLLYRDKPPAPATHAAP